MKNVQIDLEKDFSIFVGANNSGKTSATQVFHHFVGQGDRSALSIHDFSVDCRSTFDRIGSEPEGQHTTPFPTMSLDLWLKVEDADLHRVIDLIPSLRWPEGKVGIRIEYSPRDEATTLMRYRELNREASAHAQPRPCPQIRARGGWRRFGPSPGNWRRASRSASPPAGSASSD
ncbi:ATP-binding protein [Corallococcus sp. AS-1-6]|nr:ATP-binding protein [Corallococcus sp. AS-1-6]